MVEWGGGWSLSVGLFIVYFLILLCFIWQYCMPNESKSERMVYWRISFILLKEELK